MFLLEIECFFFNMFQAIKTTNKLGRNADKHKKKNLYTLFFYKNGVNPFHHGYS